MLLHWGLCCNLHNVLFSDPIFSNFWIDVSDKLVALYIEARLEEHLATQAEAERLDFRSGSVFHNS